MNNITIVIGKKAIIVCAVIAAMILGFYYAGIHKSPNTHFVLDKVADANSLHNYDTTIICKTVKQMKSLALLTAGDTVFTKGYHSANDGGHALYDIRPKKNADIDDGGSIIFLDNGNVAELIADGTVNVKQFGAVGDGVTDDTIAINNAIKFASKIILPHGIYYITSTINIDSDKNISGFFNNTKSSDMVQIKTDRDFTVIKVTGTNNEISNFTVYHDNTNKNHVLDFSGAKYLRMRNVALQHQGSCNAIALYADGGQANWVGYINIDNVFASRYSSSVKILRGSFVNFNNCKFNFASNVTLHLEGGVFNFIDCDMSNSNNALDTSLLYYKGGYYVNLIGCYMEDFFYDRDIRAISTRSIDTPVNIVGGKLGSSSNKTVGAGYRYRKTPYSDFRPSLINDFGNGFHGTVNLISNGDYHAGAMDFSTSSKRANLTMSFLSAEEVPELYGSGVRVVADSNYPFYLIHKIGNLRKGWYTLGLWIKPREKADTYNFSVAVSSRASDGQTRIWSYDFSNKTKDSWFELSGKWEYITGNFYIDETKENLDYNIIIRSAGVRDVSVTGLSLYQGKYVENGSLNTCSQKQVLTDKIILKGKDNKFYDISVNEGMVTATVIRNGQ